MFNSVLVVLVLLGMVLIYSLLLSDVEDKVRRAANASHTYTMKVV